MMRLILYSIIVLFVSGCKTTETPLGEKLSDWAPWRKPVESKEDMHSALTARWPSERVELFASLNRFSDGFQPLVPKGEVWKESLFSNRNENAYWYAFGYPDNLQYCVIYKNTKHYWIVEIGNTNTLEKIPYLVKPLYIYDRNSK